MGQLIPRGDMTKQEAVNLAHKKWLGVRDAFRLLQNRLCVPCSFCQYYDSCDACPLRNPDGGRHCVDYFAASDGSKAVMKHTRVLLKKIEEVGNSICDHELEIEITSLGDDERYFVCECGHHRSEPWNK
jgi:hypothetical protein